MPVMMLVKETYYASILALGPVDPTQPGSLKPRRNDKRIPLPEDLVLILENTPDCVPDPLLREYLLRALLSELRRPKGRPASKLSLSQCLVADVLL